MVVKEQVRGPFHEIVVPPIVRQARLELCSLLLRWLGVEAESPLFMLWIHLNTSSDHENRAKYGSSKPPPWRKNLSLVGYRRANFLDAT
jgi:hypothetical protein